MDQQPGLGAFERPRIGCFASVALRVPTEALGESGLRTTRRDPITPNGAQGHEGQSSVNRRRLEAHPKAASLCRS